MTLANALQFSLLGLLTIVVGIPGIVLGLLLPNRSLKGRFFRLVSKAYSRVALRLFGIRVAARGHGNIDPRRPYIFMANHTSLADSPVLALAISQPLHWVFKKELARIPIFGWALLASGQIMVDRSDPSGARAALTVGIQGLSGNNSIIIYPEGTRSRDGRLQPLKKGGFRAAIHSGIPIVPVRVLGSRDIMPSDGLRVRPGTVLVEIHPPIPTEGKTAEDIPALMDRVREALTLSGTPDPA
jgi:1-acyl-sn-glycerol-3-phosphate acyltransferase